MAPAHAAGEWYVVCPAPLSVLSLRVESVRCALLFEHVFEGSVETNGKGRTSRCVRFRFKNTWGAGTHTDTPWVTRFTQTNLTTLVRVR